MSQFKKGAFISYLGIFVTNITGLLLTPYIIKSLGDSDYGVYILVGSVISYLITLDFGLNNAVTRYVTKLTVTKNKKAEENLLAHIAVTAMGLMLIGSILGVLIFFNFDTYFQDSLTSEEIHLAKELMPFLLLNILVLIPTSIFTAYAHAKQNFVYPKFLNLAKTILRALAVFFALYLGYKALAIVIIDTVLNGVITFLLLVFCRHKLHFRIKLYQWNKTLWFEILYYSFWIFLASIVLKLQWQVGQTIVGLQLNATSVAVFSVGVMLGGYYNAFAFAINSMVLPRAVSLVESKKNNEEVTKDMIAIAKYIFHILLLISSGFFLFGENFILLWLGESYREAYYFALIIMIVRTIPLSQIYGNSILEAKGKNRFKSLLGLTTIGTATLVAYYLAPIYGLKGVFWPILIAMMIDNLIMNLYYTKIFKFQKWLFFKNLIGPFFIPMLVLIFGSQFIMTFFVIDSWFSFSVICLIYAFLYTAINYFLIMDEKEKQKINSLLKL